MHQVVSQTMANVRRDRPVHLLGIGGIADIFHGVREKRKSETTIEGIRESEGKRRREGEREEGVWCGAVDAPSGCMYTVVSKQSTTKRNHTHNSNNNDTSHATATHTTPCPTAGLLVDLIHQTINNAIRSDRESTRSTASTRRGSAGTAAPW